MTSRVIARWKGSHNVSAARIQGVINGKVAKERHWESTALLLMIDSRKIFLFYCTVTFGAILCLSFYHNCV